MRTSTEIGSIAALVGEERAIELVAKAGFDCWDFSMFPMFGWNWDTNEEYETHHPLAGRDYLKFARQLRRVGEDNGIVCNQGHAPFPVMHSKEDEMKRSLECLAEAGGEILVIHPFADETAQQNAETYWKFLPLAKELGVKIATENMFNWDAEKDDCCKAACCTPADFNAHLDAVNDPDFVACLDIGHAQMRGVHTSAVEMIEALGSRLCAVHVHDNDCRHDFHRLPFTMDIDFAPIMQALRRVRYKGDLTLEANQHMRDFTEENAFEGVLQMAQAARRLADGDL